MLDNAASLKRPRETESDEDVIAELCDIRADQLHNILRHTQRLAFKAPDVARQLLAMSPPMLYALLHAEYTLGMTPGVDRLLPARQSDMNKAKAKAEEIQKQIENLEAPETEHVLADVENVIAQTDMAGMSQMMQMPGGGPMIRPPVFRPQFPQLQPSSGQIQGGNQFNQMGNIMPNLMGAPPNMASAPPNMTGAPPNLASIPKSGNGPQRPMRPQASGPVRPHAGGSMRSSTTMAKSKSISGSNAPSSLGDLQLPTPGQQLTAEQRSQFLARIAQISPQQLELLPNNVKEQIRTILS
eukprot:GEMP01058014.1.p1 GENE.GEMP01058014.1~~GEMP01058014.1.p1  ORF type:complete len:305 (+),score=66.55 GEMP01058014.1:23-916(+)